MKKLLLLSLLSTMTALNVISGNTGGLFNRRSIFLGIGVYKAKINELEGELRKHGLTAHDLKLLQNYKDKLKDLENKEIEEMRMGA